MSSAISLRYVSAECGRSVALALSRFYSVYVCFTRMFLAHPVSLVLLLFTLDYRYVTVILGGFEGYFCCHYCSIRRLTRCHITDFFTNYNSWDLMKI